VLVGGLGDDPERDARSDVVGAQEAGAVAEGQGVGGAVVGVEIAPIAGGGGGRRRRAAEEGGGGGRRRRAAEEGGEGGEGAGSGAGSGDDLAQVVNTSTSIGVGSMS